MGKAAFNESCSNDYSPFSNSNIYDCIAEIIHKTETPSSSRLLPVSSLLFSDSGIHLMAFCSSSTPEPSNSSPTLKKGLNPNAEPFRKLAPTENTLSHQLQQQVMFLPHEIYQGQEGHPPLLPPQPTLHSHTALSSSILPELQMTYQAQPWQYGYPFQTTSLSGNVRYLYQPCYSTFSLQPVIPFAVVSEGDDVIFSDDASKPRQSMRKKKLERFRRRDQPSPNIGHGKSSKKPEWRVKPVHASCKANVSDKSEVDYVIPFPNSQEETVKQGITTVMIKNIPNNFRRMELMAILDTHCRQENLKGGLSDGGLSPPSKYDLIYLPMDYRKHYYENKFANLGYAFVNFTTPVAAFRFYKEFNGYRWNDAKNSKICQVTPAQYQGRALKERFACKTFMGSSREFLPVAISRPRDGFVQKTYATPIGKFRFGIPLKRLLH